eukprot:2808521-Prymnesium_polylepis.1
MSIPSPQARAPRPTVMLLTSPRDSSRRGSRLDSSPLRSSGGSPLNARMSRMRKSTRGTDAGQSEHVRLYTTGPSYNYGIGIPLKVEALRSLLQAPERVPGESEADFDR